MTSTDKNLTALDVDRPPVVEILGVSKSFSKRADKSLKEIVAGVFHKRAPDRFDALDNVSVVIEAGSTVGLLGANGSGKSTLLKAIGGIIEPTEGTIRRRGRLAALLELGAGFHPDLTGRENVYLNAAILGLTRKETDDRFADIVAFAEIGDFIDTQVKFYSSGMYLRLAFSVAIHTDPDVLLVDEVLAVGDENFQRKCMEKIREFQEEGRTIIFVSHSTWQVADICDRAVVLSHGKVMYDGPTEEGIRVFRKGLEAARHEELIAEVASDGAPIKHAFIDGVDVIVGGDSTVMPMTSGDDLHVRIRTTFNEKIAGWTSGFSLDAMSGQSVYATGSLGLGKRHPVAYGTGVVVEYTVKNFMIGGGSYYVNAYIDDPDGNRMDTAVRVAELVVEQNPVSSGVVAAGLEFTEKWNVV